MSMRDFSLFRTVDDVVSGHVVFYAQRSERCACEKISSTNATFQQGSATRQHHATMGKARVGVRLKEAVGKNSLNRSADLDQLTQQFNALQEKQKNLIIALKTQHASILQMAKSRLMVRVARKPRFLGDDCG